MDTVTHALSGALLARATAPSASHAHALNPRTRMIAGLLAAAFPDCDFALRLVDTLTYLNLHQGITHSAVMLPLWALALARLFAQVTGCAWRSFYGVVFLGIGVHIAEDFITAYGTMLLAPLSDRRFSLPLTFVIDPYFSGIIIVGLAASALWPQWNLIAAGALIALAGYVSFQWLLHQHAVAIGDTYAATNGLTWMKSYALPQPLSPFHWKVIVGDRTDYYEALVDVSASQRHGTPNSEKCVLAKMAAAYLPAAQAEWRHYARFGDTAEETALAWQAWNDKALASFRRFALFPVLDHVIQDRETTCVWFVDLRFTLPDLPPSFRYGACRTGTTKDWQLERIRGSFYID
jgi:inner membrane protein